MFQQTTRLTKRDKPCFRRVRQGNHALADMGYTNTCLRYHFIYLRSGYGQRARSIESVHDGLRMNVIN